MLTKEIAIARLRATGTLAADQRRTNIVQPEAARTPLAREVSNIMRSNTSTTRVRMLAPAVNQPVLP